MRVWAFFLLTFLSLLTLNAQTFDVDTILYNGDDEKLINIVIISDGYQEYEISNFVTDATNFSNALFSEVPYSNYSSFFNVFIIKVPSNESGANHPGTASDVNEPSHPVQVVDNYFGSSFDSYNIHRLLVPSETWLIYSVLADNFPSYDQVVILVNSPYYGGSGGQFATLSNHSLAKEIAIHELGHSFASLKDEYYAGDQYSAEQVNMSQQTNPDLVTWTNWYGDNGIGIYQHCCGGNSSSWYRPHQNCKMRYLGSPFCSVCIEATIEKIHDLTSPIYNYYPSENSVSQNSLPQSFNVELISPINNTLNTFWDLNGVTIATNIDSVLLYSSNFLDGLNTLTFSVHDNSDLLRVNNHEELHTYSISWTIDNDEPNNICQIIDFTSGWNMFSTYIVLDDMGMENVLNSLTESGNLIIVKDEIGNVFLPEWDYNAIGELDVTQGYLSKTNFYQDLDICGQQLQPEIQPLFLNQGWNMMSYLRESSAGLIELISPISNQIIIIKDAIGNAYLPEWNFNAIENFQPGKGYLIKVSEDCTFTYPPN